MAATAIHDSPAELPSMTTRDQRPSATSARLPTTPAANRSNRRPVLPRRSIMRRTVIAALAGLALALPMTAFAAPDETQKQLLLRAQEAQKKLAAAKGASGPQRQQMMQEHMKMMQEVMKQMQTAKPRENMTPQQMRDWI